MEFDFDLFVIGAGSGGVRAARIAASLGARVAICEDYRWGGTCVIRGCVPKKLFVYASHFREEFAAAAGFGWTVGEVTHDWPALVRAKDEEIARLERIYKTLLETAGVTRIDGRGRLEGAHEVRVGDRKFSARHIVIATGGKPEHPKIPGIEHAISSNEAFHLAERPKRVVIVGGGYIGVEFAGIFRGLGSHVDLVFRGDRVLRGFDEEVRAVLMEELAKKGITLHSDTTIEAIEKLEPTAGYRLTTGQGKNLETDLVFYATGRTPNVTDLGLEEVGVKVDHVGAIIVDPFSTTAVPSIHAVGDVTHRMALTPVALGEGQALAQHLFGGGNVVFKHQLVPSAVFSQPPIATVGLTEEEARRARGEIDVYTSRFRALKATLSGSEERTFIKLIVDQATQQVLGCHMVGTDAPEIVQGLAIAIKMGATKAQFDATVGIHPTAAEEFVTLRKKRAEPPAAAAE